MMNASQIRISAFTWFAVLAAGCAFLSPAFTHAWSSYPDKPITLVVPLAAGGTVDLQARVLAQAMEKELKQPVVVVNKPGGSMTVGGYAVASAKADGYTVGLLTVGSLYSRAVQLYPDPPIYE